MNGFKSLRKLVWPPSLDSLELLSRSPPNHSGETPVSDQVGPLAEPRRRQRELTPPLTDLALSIITPPVVKLASAGLG